MYIIIVIMVIWVYNRTVLGSVGHLIFELFIVQH
jgi:hypothetical protein